MKMKKIFLLNAIFILMVFFGAQAQEINFEKEIHNFGGFDQFGNGTYEFKFTNSFITLRL